MTDETQGEPQDGELEHAAADSGNNGGEIESTGNQDGPGPEPNEPELAPPASVVGERDRVSVTVTEFSQTKGVELVVNGRPFLFPIGKPITVPAWVLPSLAAVGGARFTVE